MILLDTNVISEAMKPVPDDTVRATFKPQQFQRRLSVSVTPLAGRTGLSPLRPAPTPPL